MELILWFEKHKLSTTLSCAITIKDIILNVKNALNRLDGNLIVFTNDFEALPETFVVEPNDKQKELFILQQADIPKPSVPVRSESIEELIMKVTNASNKLEYKQPEKTKSPFDLLNEHFSLKDKNLDYLLNILQALEERSHSSSHNNDNQPQTQVEPNENSVQELKGMGFPEDRVREALIRSGNDMNKATDILLNGEDA